jgi:hypothetical protein
VTIDARQFERHSPDVEMKVAYRRVFTISPANSQVPWPKITWAFEPRARIVDSLLAIVRRLPGEFVFKSGTREIRESTLFGQLTEDVILVDVVTPEIEDI